MNWLRSFPLRCFLIAAICFIGIQASIHAQEKESTDVITVTTELVVFDAQVIDKKSKRTIGDFTKEEFQIYDKGVKQQVSYFSRDELPLSILLLMDVSASVRPILHQIRDGALNALGHLKPEDHVALMAFGSKSDLVQDFTRDRSLVARKIEEATRTEYLGPGTFLGPALEEATMHIDDAPTAGSRRVIIIITDNIATSFGMEKRINEKLLDTGTVVYGLIVRGAVGKFFNVLFLGQIKGVNTYVHETGGEILGASKNEVDVKLAVMMDRLRARYAIGFRPSDHTSKDSFHPVEIKITPLRKRKEKPVVLTKRGYYLRRR
jgi:VWFA-related protein